MTRLTAPPQPQVYVHGPIRAGQIEYARRKTGAALEHAPRPVLFVRLTLGHARVRGAGQPYAVAVHADVSGLEIHAAATAATFSEAVDLAQRRLGAQLSRADRRR
ncbi:HPF/RaiA family ribosome-associated protein [Plantactinospora sp. WMMB334]|uniref:HPF/RaiA family ribosome-associated protein n=1 Tax=Plantactinospora sp. WMMB334 TaxID=3404119 RepID=UPI003B93F2BB